MDPYTTRTYRRRVDAVDLVPFEVKVRETDLWIGAAANLEGEARDLVFEARHQVESYINEHPDFLNALTPYPEDVLAPPVVQGMLRASRRVGVGPMASVAGAIAEYVGRGLLQWTDRVVVENGGDVFLHLQRSVTVDVFAGPSRMSDRIGLGVPAEAMPIGVCTSSGTVGHSMSMGKADAVCVLSRDTALADSAATALGNRIRSQRDLEDAARWIAGIEGISGTVLIVGKALSAWGDVELVAL
jgi:hypothetical protein